MFQVQIIIGACWLARLVYSQAPVASFEIQEPTVVSASGFEQFDNALNGVIIAPTDRAGLKDADCGMANLVASDLSGGDQFGYSVSADSQIAVVGASWQSCHNGVACGAAYVFRLTGGSWQQEAKLENPDSEAYSYFGTAVGVAGNVIAVGSPLGGCENVPGPYCGSIYVYQFVDGKWALQQRLIAPNSEDSWVGETISISGNVILAGARFAECENGISCGAAHVWVYDGATWQYNQRLDAPSSEVEAFGQSVSTNGELLLLGAIGTDCPMGRDCGEAYVYKSDQGIWRNEQKLLPSSPSANGIFGWSVSLEQDFAIISAPGETDCGGLGLAGAVYIFKKQSDTWVQDAELCVAGTRAFDFGWAVAADGDHALVSARRYRCMGDFECGAVLSFVLDGGAWVLEQTIVNPVPTQSGGNLGHSLAVLGNKAFIGVTNFACCGATYAVSLGPDCNHNGQADFCDIRDDGADDGDSDGVPDECELVASLDFEPGKCPNRMRPRERGVIEAAVAGSEAFDVTQVDVGSLELRRADGLGGAVHPSRTGESQGASPISRLGGVERPRRKLGALPNEEQIANSENRIRIRDVATFETDGSCECGEDGRDGFDDLIVKFDAKELIETFELDGEKPGAVIEVEIVGAQIGGTIYKATDCIVVGGREGKGSPQQ